MVLAQSCTIICLIFLASRMYYCYFFSTFKTKSSEVGLLLTTNQMRAHKDLAFSVTRNVFKLESLDPELRGYGISPKMALIWQIRHCHFHQDISRSDVLEFNLKLDGRPLFQVFQGIFG